MSEDKARSSLPPTRITVVKTVYVQSPGIEPHSYDLGYTRVSQTEEEPTNRRIRLGEDAAVVSTMGLSNPKTLIVKNEAPMRTTNPSPEEREYDRRRVIEVGLATSAENQTQWDVSSEMIPIASIAIGESVQIDPIDWTTLRIRCRSGETFARLIVIPG